MEIEHLDVCDNLTTSCAVEIMWYDGTLQNSNDP